MVSFYELFALCCDPAVESGRLRAPMRLLVFTLIATGCAAQPQARPRQPVSTPSAPTRTHVTTPHTPRCAQTHGITLEGQLGTISQGNVRRVFQDAEAHLNECYTARLSALPWLSGRIELTLRVGLDGAVRWAVPSTSTFGDRVTEQCFVDRAKALRFDAPCGGEAQVTWSTQADPGPDVRPPITLPSTFSPRITALLRQHRAALTACGPTDNTTPVEVLFTVASDGTIASAGASASTPAALERTDCIVREVLRWHTTSPGSWYARGSATIP